VSPPHALMLLLRGCGPTAVSFSNLSALRNAHFWLLPALGHIVVHRVNCKRPLLIAGVKNIHAYSWLAHARKYLESIASEKRHLVNRKKFGGGRASGNWDHHSHLADHAEGCADQIHTRVSFPGLILPSPLPSGRSFV